MPIISIKDFGPGIATGSGANSTFTTEMSRSLYAPAGSLDVDNTSANPMVGSGSMLITTSGQSNAFPRPVKGGSFSLTSVPVGAFAETITAMSVVGQDSLEFDGRTEGDGLTSTVLALATRWQISGTAYGVGVRTLHSINNTESLDLYCPTTITSGSTPSGDQTDVRSVFESSFASGSYIRKILPTSTITQEQQGYTSSNVRLTITAIIPPIDQTISSNFGILSRATSLGTITLAQLPGAQQDFNQRIAVMRGTQILGSATNLPKRSSLSLKASQANNATEATRTKQFSRMNFSYKSANGLHYLFVDNRVHTIDLSSVDSGIDPQTGVTFLTDVLALSTTEAIYDALEWRDLTYIGTSSLLRSEMSNWPITNLGVVPRVIVWDRTVTAVTAIKNVYWLNQLKALGALRLIGSNLYAFGMGIDGREKILKFTGNGFETVFSFNKSTTSYLGAFRISYTDFGDGIAWMSQRGVFWFGVIPGSGTSKGFNYDTPSMYRLSITGDLDMILCSDDTKLYIAQIGGTNVQVMAPRLGNGGYVTNNGTNTVSLLDGKMQISPVTLPYNSLLNSITIRTEGISTADDVDALTGSIQATIYVNGRSIGSTTDLLQDIITRGFWTIPAMRDKVNNVHIKLETLYDIGSRPANKPAQYKYGLVVSGIDIDYTPNTRKR